MNERNESLGWVVRNQLQLRDVVAILSVPVLLVLVFALPTAVRTSLAFDYSTPSLLAAFTSAFVHLDPTHLTVNLAGYALLVPLTYLMSSACGYRQRFYASFATYLAVFPLLLTMFQLLFIRPGMALGFSGVLMAFYGYLPLVMSDVVSERFDIDVQTNVAPLLFFVGMGIITVLGVFPSLDSMTVLLGSAGLLLAILLIVLWYALSIHTGGASWATVTDAWAAAGHFELFVISIVVFLSFPFAMFPPDVTVENVFVDTYTHFLAYSLGFLAAYTSSYLSIRIAGESGRGWM